MKNGIVLHPARPLMVTPSALGTSNVTSRDGGGTWKSSSGSSGTSSSVGQYHLTTCMDFPVSHLWGWWMCFFFSRFLFELQLLYSKMVLSYGVLFLPDIVCTYFNDTQYICE